MYVRFVSDRRDEVLGFEIGIFQLVAGILRDKELPKNLHDELGELRDWFNEKLDKPTQFSKSKRPNAYPDGICWFKESAVDAIRQILRIVYFLEAHGYRVTKLRTPDPGYILYEDAAQVVARETSSSRSQTVRF